MTAVATAVPNLERPAAPQADPTRRLDLEAHRPALTRFARQLLRDDALADDAVQETLLAALRSPERFAGRSSLDTWLHGILKHKIADVFRRQARELPLADDSDDELNELFAADGRWRAAPPAWRDPEAALAERHFFETLEACIACLPRNTARVFTMRELMGLEIDDICRDLNVSRNHCSVMLHRARLKLRTLLEQRWFGVAAA